MWTDAQIPLSGIPEIWLCLKPMYDNLFERLSILLGKEIKFSEGLGKPTHRFPEVLD